MLQNLKPLLFPLTIACLLALASAPARAGKADVVDATASHVEGRKFRIDATLLHQDEGWDHYANAWHVLDENGNLLGTRVLAHPHVNEQPFTRSLTVKIPDGIDTVVIEAVDSVHGKGGKQFTLKLPSP